MKGYVKNISRDWAYIMKRTVRPGGEIPIDELYEQYGKKHNIEPGDDFNRWLSEVKLYKNDKFEIVFDKVTKAKSESKVVRQATGSDGGVPPMVEKGLKVEDIVSLSVRAARVEIKKIRDVKLLKYALEEANKMTGKESLCRLLRKHLKDLGAFR